MEQQKKNIGEILQEYGAFIALVLLIVIIGAISRSSELLITSCLC